MIGRIASGILGAVLVTRVIATFLYGLSPTDPQTFLGISVALIATLFSRGLLPDLQRLRQTLGAQELA